MPSRIKGATLINTIVTVRELTGPVVFQALIEGCPAETKQILPRTLMAVEWIPVDTWSPFLTAILERLAKRNEDQYRRIIRAVCKRDFSTVYRALIQGATPSTVLGKMQNIWHAYFDNGTLAVKPGQTLGQTQRTEFQLRDLETTSNIYSITVQAYLEQVLTMAGAHSVSVHRQKELLKDGRLSCDYQASFAIN
ncbi:MAG TPA: hypothetical protein PK472_13080 [Pseudomonadota bacterium]|nr:hypothetical protein [Pseudomonadota bacterium]HNN50856.1 hypothetical protein [Pseudomonadota bacterium]